jgi:Zn-finger nucleic acid-binding protein
MKLLLDRQQFYCEYCTSIYFPRENQDGIRVLDQDSEVICPVCQLPLVYGYIAHTQTLHCLNCKGLLIDQDTFLFIINHLRANSTNPPLVPPPVNFTDLDRALYCPDCGGQMSTHPYGGPGNLIVDNCIRCNLLWLDHNELKRVIRAPGRERFTDSEIED